MISEKCTCGENGIWMKLEMHLWAVGFVRVFDLLGLENFHRSYALVVKA